MLCEHGSKPYLKIRRGLFISMIDDSCTDNLMLKEKLKTPIFVINGFCMFLKKSYREISKFNSILKI